jgi:hypothetical protein
VVEFLSPEEYILLYVTKLCSEKFLKINFMHLSYIY